MKFSAASGWFSGDYAERVRTAAVYGFKGLENLGWLGMDLSEARRLLDENGVTSTCLLIQSKSEDNRNRIAWGHGMVWEDAREAFITSFRESVAAAKILGAPTIVATTGNERTDISRDAQMEICIDTLRAMAPMAEEAGVTIVLEPLNIRVNHAGHFLTTTDDAVKMVDAVGSPACKILFDIYHQQITEGDVTRHICDNIDKIGHFHIADNPGRQEPGTGEINYAHIFRAIQQTSYDGWLAFECGRSVELPALCAAMHALIDPFMD